MSNTQAPFQPFFVDEEIPSIPVVPGRLIATSANTLWIDTETRGRQYFGDFITVESMQDLEEMNKSTSKLYCVGVDLFRWDGEQLHCMTGGGGGAGLDGTVGSATQPVYLNNGTLTAITNMATTNYVQTELAGIETALTNLVSAVFGV